MKNLSLQFLQEDLKRVSEWIRFADQKTAFIAVYYSAIFAFLFQNREIAISKLLECNGWILSLLYINLFLIIVVSACGMASIFFALFPRLKNSFTDKSLFYFGTVSGMKPIDFIQALELIAESDAKKQISEQIYTNSIIADQKMKHVKFGTQCLFGLMFLIAIFILFK